MRGVLRRFAALAAASAFILGGCSTGTNSSGSAASSTMSAASVSKDAFSSSESAVSSTPSWDGGVFRSSVCTIYCYDDELEKLVSKYLTGYEEISRESTEDGTKTEIRARCRDGRIRWIIQNGDEAEYTRNLDKALVGSADSTEDDIPDIYMVPGSVLSKYTSEENKVAMTMDDLGISARDRKYMYKFTETMAQNESGNVCAVTWEVPFGAFVYRRSTARSVFGTDDPAEVQNFLKDEQSFSDSARKLKTAGYQIYADLSSGFDSYMADSSASWTDTEFKIKIDQRALSWSENTRTLYDEGCISELEQGSSEWYEKFSGDDASVFGSFLTADDIETYLGSDAFYSASDIDKTLSAGISKETENPESILTVNEFQASDSSTSADTLRASESTDAGSADRDGDTETKDWALCRGPAAFAKGGKWVLVNPSTDTKSLDRKILSLAVCNTNTAEDICRNHGGLVNNSSVMDSLKNVQSGIFGGQKALGLMTNLAENTQINRATYTDIGLKNIFVKNFILYIKGDRDKAECLEYFYTDALNEFPDLLT